MKNFFYSLVAAAMIFSAGKVMAVNVNFMQNSNFDGPVGVGLVPPLWDSTLTSDTCDVSNPIIAGLGAPSLPGAIVADSPSNLATDSTTWAGLLSQGTYVEYIHQTVPDLIPGETYDITWEQANYGGVGAGANATADSGIEVLIDDVLVFSDTIDLVGEGWKDYKFSFVASSNLHKFSYRASGSMGSSYVLVDNLQVVGETNNPDPYTVVEEEDNTGANSSGANSKKSRKASIRKICSDPEATNYSDTKFGRHYDSFCKYDESKKKNSCPIFTQHMKKGDVDGRIGQSIQENSHREEISEIMKLQASLISLGFDSGPIDGIFGSLTKNALMNWQNKNFDKVLSPWGLNAATGHFYQSSRWYMNQVLGCDDSVLLDNGVTLNKK